MPIIITDVANPRSEAQEIIKLYREFNTQAQDAETRFRVAKATARSFGHKLIAEQKWVLKELGHKAWESYFELTFASTFSIRTAYNWMQAAKHEQSHLQNCTISNSAAAVLQESASQQRKEVQYLGLLPKKIHNITEEAGQRHVALNSAPNHFSWINPFNVWLNAIESQGDQSPEDIAIILLEAKRVVSYFDQIRAISV